MFFVSAIEKLKYECNIFVTDTRDLVTECYSYNKLVSILDSTDLKVHGVCRGIGLPFVENYNMQTCYLTSLDYEDSYSTLVDGIDIFFGRDASFVSNIIYYMEQGRTEYTTFYDTECQGLYGLIKCFYQISRISWDTDKSIYNTGFFSKDSDTAILIFLRNVYNYRNGLPLLPLDIEKSGTKLVPDIEDIECVVYSNFVYYIYDDVVMRVSRNKILWDYKPYLDYITRVGLTTSEKLYLSFCNVVVSGNIETLHLVDGINYKIAMSTKIDNLYLDSENIKLTVQRGTKIGVLYAYSNSKALKSLFSGAKIGKLVLDKDIISGFILYNISLLKGLYDTKFLGMSDVPQFRNENILVSVVGLNTKEDKDVFVRSCFKDEEWDFIHTGYNINNKICAIRKIEFLNYNVENIDIRDYPELFNHI